MNEAPDQGALPDGAELLPDGKVRYTLKWPVTYRIGNEEQRLETITIRRKVYADNLAIKAIGNPVDLGFTLLCRLTGLDAKIVQEIDDVDSDAFGQIVEGFTPPGPQTQTSAPGS